MRIAKNLVNKRASMVAMAFIVTIAIAASLWFSVPALALTISLPTQPSSGTLGSTYSFTVQVDVENTDLLPIDHIDFEIYNVASPATYRFTCTDLPIPTGAGATETKSYTPTGAGTVSVSATTGSGWGGASPAPTSRYGYGFGYQSGWGTYTFDTNYGYGYDSAAASYIGATSITYSITWTSPSSWPQGAYEINFLVYGNGSPTAFTTPTTPSFTLYVPTVAGPPPPEPGVTDVSDVVDENGVFTETVTAESEDGNVGITIDEGITGLTEAGEPLSEISIIEMEEEDVPSPPEEGHVIGVTYNIGPDGATFSDDVTLTFTYDPDDLPDGVNEEDLVIAIWDEDAGEWVELPSVVDTENNTVTATVGHFTAFAIIVPPVEEEAEVAGVEEEEELIQMVPEEEEEEVPPVVEEEEGIAWWVWLIVGLASAAVAGLLVYFVWWRQRFT